MCNNLFFMLSAYHKLKLKDFSREALVKRESEFEADTTTIEEDYETIRNRTIEKVKHMPGADRLSREELEDLVDEETDRLMEKQKGGAKDVQDWQTGQYYYRGFAALESDSVFRLRFSENENKGRLEDPENVWATSQKTRNSNAGLGINNMYIMPPDYYRLKEIKRSRQYRYDKAESAALQQPVQAQLATSAKTAKKGYFLITPQTMDSTRVADYNTYCMLQQWLEEETSHSSNSLALNLSHAELADSLTRKLGTQYVMISSIVCEKQKRVRHIGSFVIACVIPYTLPIAFFYGITPRNRSHMISLVYDIKTGELVFFYEDYTKNKATPPRANMFFSKVFRKTSRKP
jgi:hypothetical protein